jgi:hypothetical protein
MPRTVLFQIEAHLVGYVRNNFFVGIFRREFRLLRRRVVSIVPDGIPLRHDLRREDL